MFVCAFQKGFENLPQLKIHTKSVQPQTAMFPELGTCNFEVKSDPHNYTTLKNMAGTKFHVPSRWTLTSAKPPCNQG